MLASTFWKNCRSVCVLAALALPAGLVRADSHGKSDASAEHTSAKAEAAGDRSEATPRRGRGENAVGLKGYYAIVAGQIGLSPKKQISLKQIIEDRDLELRQWDRRYAERLKMLRADARKARRGDDEEAVEAAEAAVAELQDERDAIVLQAKARIKRLLNKQEEADWAGWDLYVNAMRRFSRLGVTVEQKQQIRELAMDLGDRALEAEDDRAKLAQVRFELARAVADEVLTERQREAFEDGSKRSARSSTRSSSRRD